MLWTVVFVEITKDNKKEWILEYMNDSGHFVDITEEKFANAYIDKFNPDVIEWYPYGAPKVLRSVSCLPNCIKRTKY